MKKIILDTNMLLVPGQFMVDIYAELERIMEQPYILVVLDKTIQELLGLCDGKTKDAHAARLGLALLNARLAANPTVWEKLLGLVPDRKERKIEVVRVASYVDDAIVALADADTIVATNDKGLQKRLKKKGISLIVLKGKKQLVFQYS